MRLPGLCEDYLIESFSPIVGGREAALAGGGSSRVAPSARIAAGDEPTITRSAAACGRRWLAADCALNPRSTATGSAPGCTPSSLTWDPVHQLWSWPHTGPSPSLSPQYPFAGDPLSIVVADPAASRIAVGSFYGFVRSPHLACTGGPRRRDVVGLYDCDSRPGDCGSLVLSRSGVVGLHAGTLSVNGRKYNAFYPFVLGRSEPSSTDLMCESEVRHSGKGTGKPAPRAASASLRVVQTQPKPARESKPAPRASTALVKSKPKREAGIVGMGPAPSSLPGRGQSSHFTVDKYIDALLNPWASPYLRLPDRVVVPTSLARFVKNSTITVVNTALNGSNLVFGISNRVSCVSNTTTRPIETGSITSVAAGVIENVCYPYGPGSILSPLQWGAGAHVDPRVSMDYRSYVPPSTAQTGVWGDDFGSAMRTTLPYMAAYRTISMAIRVRIVGLPPSQFMTPGKIYFAQVRNDHIDLPVTEQDFSTLEALGRASHVSADAVRAAGSKTLYWLPDGEQKFSMVSSFLPACGTFDAGELSGGVITSAQGAGLRQFPTPAIASTRPTDFTRNIIPYRASGVSTDAGAPGFLYGGSASSPDAVNADSSSILLMAYFGAADSVVLEVDYAHIVEYIPTQSAPGGVEALVQLPDSTAMDSIFAAAAVMAEARPVMLQQPGDLSLVSTGRGMAPASREALNARDRLSSMSRQVRGGQYREGFWDFGWLKKGSLGDSNVSWDFTDRPRR